MAFRPSEKPSVVGSIKVLNNETNTDTTTTGLLIAFANRSPIAPHVVISVQFNPKYVRIGANIEIAN